MTNADPVHLGAAFVATGPSLRASPQDEHDVLLVRGSDSE